MPVKSWRSPPSVSRCLPSRYCFSTSTPNSSASASTRRCVGPTQWAPRSTRQPSDLGGVHLAADAVARLEHDDRRARALAAPSRRSGRSGPRRRRRRRRVANRPAEPGGTRSRFSSPIDSPPSRSAVSKPSAPSSPASSLRRNSFSGPRSASSTWSRAVSTRIRCRGRGRRREPRKALALLGVEAAGHHDRALVSAEALGGGGSSSSAAFASISSSGTRPASSVRTFAVVRTRALLLDDPLGQRLAVGLGRRRDQQQAARRVAKLLGRAQHLAADRDVAAARRAGAARTLGGPPGPLVGADLDAAWSLRFRSSGRIT